MITQKEIHDALWHLYKHRNCTLEKLRAAGFPIREQHERLETLRIQLESLKDKGLSCWIKTTAGMKSKLYKIMPEWAIHRREKWCLRVIAIIEECEAALNLKELS